VAMAAAAAAAAALVSMTDHSSCRLLMSRNHTYSLWYQIKYSEKMQDS